MHVKSLILNAKSSFYRNELQQSRDDITRTWSKIRNIVPGRKTQTINFDDNFMHDKASDFNIFFANIGKSIFEQLQNSGVNVYLRDEVFRPNALNEVEVFKPESVNNNAIILVISKMKDTISVGCDGIPLCFIRDGLHVIAFYLTCIINTCTVTGMFPMAWKEATVVPIHKSSRSDEIGSYRPISLLPIL